MVNSQYLWKFLSIVVLLVMVCSSVIAQEVPIAPKPMWVKDQPFKLDAEIPVNDIKNGVYYLLVDWQTQVTKNNSTSAFRHLASQGISTQGVEDISQINIEFDPNYQQLILHKLVIWRDGKAIDKSQSAKMSLLQQEKELSKLIYNGDKTLNILIDDVRINDIVEYSYSLNGSNPIFADGFSLTHSLNWRIPVEFLNVRLLWHKTTPLFFEIKNSEIAMQQTPFNGGTEYLLQQEHVAPSSEQANTPRWFNAFAMVSFSDVKDWAQVNRWGTPLFENAYRSTPEIKQLAAKIAGQTTSKSQQIANILQFVQSQVRYLGIEFGENSHRPSSAAETLARHYGDCKDKVVLFISLLKEIGVTAYPALVDTDIKDKLKSRLPKYNTFNHVIAQVTFDGKAYWLDPTRLNQKGDLFDIFQPDYGYALVLDGESQHLTPVEINQARSQIVVTETFDMTNAEDLSAHYQVITEYSRRESDIIRSRLEERGLTQLREDYLDFYQGYYDHIKTENALEFSDDKSNNKVISRESYLVDPIWEANEKKQKYYARFYANLLSPAIDIPEDKTREHPLAVDKYVDLQQTIIVNLDDRKWQFSEDNIELDNQFFHFKYRVEFSAPQNRLTLYFAYQSKVDSVAAEHYDEYLAALNSMDDNFQYRIQKRLTDTLGKKSAPKFRSLGYQQWLLIGLFIYIYLLLAITLRQKMHKKAHSDPDTAAFYPVSLLKFSVFWLLTFGCYGVYWFYKNWLYVKNQQQNAQLIMPFTRSLFSLFWYYPLYMAVKKYAAETHNNLGLRPIWAALAAICYLILFIASSTLESTILVYSLTVLPLLPLVLAINQLNLQYIDTYEKNSKWRYNDILIVFAFAPWLILSFGPESHLIPTSNVIKGSDILSFDLKYLQRKKVINPGDDIKQFYSDAILSIRNDGNGFSDRHVFSYWKDDIFNYETASYTDIADIKVTWSTSVMENTVIDIRRKDDSNFLLYVDKENGQDRHFVTQLQQLWRTHSKETP